MRVLLDVLLCPREGLAHVCTTDVAVLLTTPAARWPLGSAGQRRAGKRYHTVSVHLHAMVHSSGRSEDWFMFPTSEIVSRVIAAPRHATDKQMYDWQTSGPVSAAPIDAACAQSVILTVEAAVTLVADCRTIRMAYSQAVSICQPWSRAALRRNHEAPQARISPLRQALK